MSGNLRIVSGEDSYNNESVIVAVIAKQNDAQTARSAVERGHSRVLGQLALRDAFLAAAVALSGPAVLLVLGTDYFPLALLWLFTLGGIAVAAWHWLRSRPTPYRVAQRMDQQWVTEDQISTAFYFSKEGSRAAGWAELQRLRANEAAADGDLSAALPFRTPRAAYAMVSVILLAAVLFLLRYGTQPTLSLKPPLPPLILQALLGDERTELAVLEQKPPDSSASDEPASSLNEEKDADDPVRASESDPLQQEVPLVDDVGDELAMPEVDGLSVEEEYGDELASGDSARGEEEGAENEAQKAGTEGDSTDPSRQDPTSEWSKESNDLLDRLQEAFKNMLKKLNMDEPSMGQPQPSGMQSEQASQSPGNGQEAAGEQTAAQQGSESQSEGGQSQKAAEQFSIEEGGSPSSEQQSETSVATAGSGEGSKELREAAQAQAMGELSELYQQRAEEISGEFMVETESAQQTARTPYSPKESGHLDRGAALSRDEIPMAYRSYIKQYFRRIRQETGN